MKKMFITLLGVGLLATLLLSGCKGDGSKTDGTDNESNTSAETSGDVNGSSMLPGAGTYIVSNIEDMLALEPQHAKAVVIVKGYYMNGDGGGGTFYYDSSSRLDEDKGLVFKGNARGRFIRQCEENKLNVKWFGAKGDGATDDAPAIQAAIDALPKGGGTVTVPGGTYLVKTTINLGDGDAGEKVSTKAGIKLIGMGGGFSHNVAASTSIIAGAEMDSVIAVNGRISDVEIAGLYLGGGDGKAKTGLFLHSFTGGYFHNLNIIGFKETGLKIMAGTAPTGNYNIYNRFESIGVFAIYDNSTALDMDGHYTDNNDTWLSVFTDCRFDTTQTKGSAAAHFKFVDSISFYRCHFNCYNEESVGAIFDAIGHNSFPSGMGFYDCSVKSMSVIESATDKIRPQYFYGFGTEDGEEIPTHSKLIGITDHGETFNMDDIDIFHAAEANGGKLPEYWVAEKAGRVDTYTNGYPDIAYNLVQGNTAAVLINTKEDLVGGSVYVNAYGTPAGDKIQFTVYRWDTDYATTVSKDPLDYIILEDCADQKYTEFKFNKELEKGYFLILVTGSAAEGDTGVAVYTQKPADKNAAITFVNGERVDAGLRFIYITK